MLRNILESRLAKPAFQTAIAILVEQGVVATVTGLVKLPSHASSIRAADQKLWEQISAILKRRPFKPPPLSEIAEDLNKPIKDLRKVCKTMVRLEELVEVRKDRFFLKSALAELGELAHRIARANDAETFTVAEFRDSAGCGRAIAVQVLEYFDRRGITGRRGDARIIAKAPTAVFGDTALM